MQVLFQFHHTIRLESDACQSVESPHSEFKTQFTSVQNFPVLTGLSTDLGGPCLRVWIMSMCRPVYMCEWCVLAR